MARSDQWHKLYAHVWIAEFARIPNPIARGICTSLALLCVAEGSLPDNDTELAYLSMIDEDQIKSVRPYLNRHCITVNGRLVFRVVSDMFSDTEAELAKARADLLTSSWRALRKLILKRDNGICGYCGSLADTVDHITPFTRGGDSSEENLVSACRSCNSKKSNFTPTEAGMRLIYFGGARIA